MMRLLLARATPVSRILAFAMLHIVVLVGAWLVDTRPVAASGLLSNYCQPDSDGDAVGYGTGVCTSGSCSAGYTLVWSGGTFGIDCSSAIPENDNCSTVANASQLDTNGDGIGDACIGTPQTITVTTAAPANALFGDAFTVAATASSGLPVTITVSGGCALAGSVVTMIGGSTNCTVSYNQAGNATYKDAPQITSVTKAMLLNPIQVGVGEYHTCALDSRGLYCWGMDFFGPPAMLALSHPVQFDMGSYHACAIDDTGVHCIGSNERGATTVPALSNPVQVSAGDRHTCAIDDTGVHCWGAGTTIGNCSSYWYDVECGQSIVPTLVHPVQVSAGNRSTCAIDDTGVHCWGLNSAGQTTVPALINPVQVSVGQYYACALDSTGVHCWGHNGSGKTTVPALVNPVQVSAGYRNTCVIDDTGVHCWGAMDLGYYYPDMPALVNPVQVSASDYFCALDDTGVVCWGDNAYGQSENVAAQYGQVAQTITVTTAAPASAANNSTFPVAATASSGLPVAITLSGGCTITSGVVTMTSSTTACTVRYRQVGNATYAAAQVTSITTVIFIDTDSDGVTDATDNCPTNANTNQLDSDSDSIGDVCDDDIDGDGLTNIDEASLGTNPLLVDTDGDSFPDNIEVMGGTDPLDAASHPALPIAILGDTDGDGFGDVVTWNITTGNGYQYLMSSNNLRAAAPNTGTAFVGLLPSGYTQFALADFNRDGSQDTLLRNNSNGTWLMLEYNLGSPGSIAMNVALSTNLADVFVAAADINGDGYKDVLLRNTSTGAWTAYFLQGDVVLSSSAIPATLLLDWQTAAVADFNGDGKADLLLRNTTTQMWYLYELDGAAVLRSGVIGMAGTGWDFAGAGDFNADGIQDVLVRRASDSAWFEYTFNDYANAGTTRFKSSGSMGLTPMGAAGLAWSVLALADADGSGTTDVVLYRSSDSTYFLYGLGGVTGRTVIGSTVLPMSTNPNWVYQTMADYNGDGKLDFLVRWVTAGNFYSGKSYVYGFGSYTAGSVWSYQGYATSITTDLAAQVIK